MKYQKTKDWRGKATVSVWDEQGKELGQLVKEKGTILFQPGHKALTASELREIADRLERPKARPLPKAQFARLNEHERSAILIAQVV